MAKTNIYLESKPRYEILDGLRGVAALMVVLFHIFETYSKGPASGAKTQSKYPGRYSCAYIGAHDNRNCASQGQQAGIHETHYQ